MNEIEAQVGYKDKGRNRVCPCTQVIYEEYKLTKPIEKLLPALRLHGINLAPTRVVAWVDEWLRNKNGFFWGRSIATPSEGYVYRAQRLSKSRHDEESGRYTTRFAIGDCHGSIESEAPLPSFFPFLVTKTSNTRCRGEVSESTDYSQTFKKDFIEYYTANGITGTLEDLADTGAALLTDIVPNEKLQSDLLLCIPRKGLVTVEQYPIEPIYISAEHTGSSFSYAIDCEKCNGEGRLQCDKCNSAGSLTCFKCNGAGHVTCRKCGGTGDHYNAKGYRYDCRLCGGSGHLTCNKCNGSGEITCFVCNGEGIIECYVCKGMSVVWVKYDRNTKEFYRRTKDRGSKIIINAETVYLFRESGGVKRKISGCWKGITSALKKQSEREMKIDEKEKELLKDAAAVRCCLDKVFDFKPGEEAYRPLTIHSPTATTDRVKRKVVYEFTVKGRFNGKGRHHEKFPYPEKMQMRIVDGDMSIDADNKIHFMGYDPSCHTIKLSFSTEIDLELFSDREIQICPAEPRPPEIRQIRYLDEWMDGDRNELLRSLTENAPISINEPVNYFNPRINKFESQKKAVAYSISNAPITLLQGPPGTGKTTVIVEIIRQMLARGKRVLVTSQTHQAVCNVLENLHELKTDGKGSNIEMVRYSADESKLTEIEEKYQAGYHESERQEILSKAASSLTEIRDKIEQTSRLVPVYEKMIAVALKAERINGDVDEKINKINSEEKQRICNTEDKYATQRKTAERDYNERNEELVNAVSCTSKSIEETLYEINKTKERIALYKDRLGRKTKGSFSDRFWELVEKKLSIKQSVSSLEGELPKEEIALQQHEVKLESLKERKKGLEQDVANLKAAYAHALSGLAVREKLETTAIQNDAQEKIKITNRDRWARLSPCFAEQEKNISNLQAGKSNITVNTSSADIERIKGRVISQLADLEKREKFKAEWSRELEASPGVLGKFLNTRVKVFMATCVGVGGWKDLLNGTYEQDGEEDTMMGKPARPKFDLVIIDEAGHATFGETVIPMMFAKRVLMVGDDNQLPPICGEDLPCLGNMGQLCESGVDHGKQDCWLEYSLFEYLWTRKKRFDIPRLMLDTQFRMHPDIGTFISTAFYEGHLKNGVNATERHFIFDTFTKPVCVLSTSKYPKRFETHNGTSYSNELEADFIKKMIEALIRDLNSQGSDTKVSLAIITPYSNQVRLLRQKLNDFFISPSRKLEFTEDDIASVDKFQGSERDIVISSFVRSPKPCNKCNGIGKVNDRTCSACGGKGHKSGSFKFVHDLKRTNVAFSRAKKMLILVGDMDALCRYKGNREGQEVLIDFAKYVLDKGKVLHVWENEEI